MAEISNSKLLQATGILNSQDACVVIVRTEWNENIVTALEQGCKKKLREHGVTNIKVIQVPGAFEIAFAIKNYWEQNQDPQTKPAVFIALGCVLRGDTPHFDYVCKAVTDGVVQLNLMLPVPTIFGVLTVDKQQQAEERIGGVHGHKGEEAAMTALKMIQVMQAFKK
ncbi:MAG TPA: 6,7-dimethyl-8-ribityllumazine synthase [Puia sp.]|jgi:6,7-dimethyl-8-ribityllumazine synthase|nr:6,7-dimethyl-8-ribityllumazine synthase [Puia sp.]